MQSERSRRGVLGMGMGLGMDLILGPSLSTNAWAGEPAVMAMGDARPFSFESLKAQAQTLASQPWLKALPSGRDTLDQIDFDSHQKIRFRPDASLWIGKQERVPIQLFHPGKWFMDPVAIHIVEGGLAREVRYSPSLFEMPDGHPARTLTSQTGFAGFRVMDRGLTTDWLAFLGASYFRSAAPFNQYGLSARGLAINTATPAPEEFPRFTGFWLDGGTGGDAPLTICALLDSPSVAGAYRFAITRQGNAGGKQPVVMEVECELTPRVDITRAGIATFSSMFWYGKGRHKGAVDWRPELHDSDGLALLTGAGEWIWRPLNNPDRIVTRTSSFLDRNVKGFGLLQRDRDFSHYLDDSLFYERRPSVWVEPLDSWGEGAVQLVEIHTDDEATDNIVAYWTPKDGLKAGQNARYRYRLSWLDDITFPDSLGRVIASWQGVGGDPTSWDKRPAGVRRFVTDWQGPVFAGVTRTEVTLDVSASRGRIMKSFAHNVVGQPERWRSVIDLAAAGPEAVDLRVNLRRGETALTETWVGQYFPEA